MLDVQSLLKYLLEGLAVAVAAFYIPRRNSSPKEIAMIAVTAAAVFAVLDLFSPVVSQGTRQGAGFGIGTQLVGGADSDSESECDYNVEPMDDTDMYASSPAPAPQV